jgi:hypothetical protein
VRRADNLTTFMCRLSRNLGTSTSWNPKGLSSPVQGLLYLLRAQAGGTDENTDNITRELTMSAAGPITPGILNPLVLDSKT